MKSFAWYDLQVIICSAIMMSYYFLVLRNKKFHQYNRFYILAVFFLSFIIPLVKIQLDKMNADNTAVQFIYVLADYNVEMDKAVAGKGFQLSWNMMAIVGYTTVSVFFLFTFIIALLRIKKLLKQYSCKSLGEIYLIFTNVKGTPFSFFKYIFWNEEIDLQSSTGQQILQHELTHVKEKHSVDNIITQVVMIFGWFNPFFWWARKELHMIHEFIADKKSVDNGDASSLAEMLLAATYPQQQFLLTNSFFFSPIKRRLLMITNNKNPRFSYLRRLVVLPLMAVVVMLFAFRMKEQNAKSGLLNNQATFFDATQDPSGAGVSQADLDEYEAIIKSVIKTFITNDGKTRTMIDGSKTKETKRAYEIWQAMNAEQRGKVTQVSFLKVPPSEKKLPSIEQLKIWTDSKMYGVWINEKRVSNTDLINLNPNDFGTYFVSKLEKNAINYGKHYYQVNLYTINYFNTKMRKDTLIMIGPKQPLKSVDSLNKPLSIVQVANDTTGKQPIFFVDGKKITHDEMSKINPNDIESMSVLKDKSAIDKYGDDGKNGVVEIKMKTAKPLYILNGKQMPKDFSLSMINENDIESVNVLKNEAATFKYGDDGKNGVMEITTKKKLNANQIPSRTEANKKDAAESYDKVFTQTQVPAEFPGGKEAWMKYLVKNLKRDLPVKNGAGPGKYKVELSFIVDANGGISDIKAENDPGFGTAEEAIRMIKNGPMWIPAKQNGKNVTSLAKQTITFVISEE